MEVYYTILNRVISEYKSVDDTDKMNLFITDYIHTHENDPYIAYYLLTIAENFKKENSREVAETYFRRILYNYSDLIINDQSIHKLILEELAFHSENYEERVNCFLDLLKRFPSQIDKGQIYYYLGESYATVSLWDEAFAAYEDFLIAPETEIAGDPQARNRLTDLLRFHRSDKSWTRTDLDQLVINIRSAIYQRNGSKLIRYKADKFFTMSWSQDVTDMFTHTKLDIPSFLNSSVQVTRDLDLMSNESEAFLRSWGWSYRIRTWYLYFKKIDYPADPEINGRWEWAGIYFGDPF
jgi:tetratricopeptide (TPR) repeat protein